MAVSTLFPSDQSASGVMVLDLKQECPTYLKTIGKSKALAASLSVIESQDDLDNNDDEEILNAFIATMNLLRGL